MVKQRRVCLIELIYNEKKKENVSLPLSCRDDYNNQTYKIVSFFLV